MFNWRLPLFAWLNGNLPDLIWGQLLLSILALATVLMVYGIMRAESGIPTAMAAVFLVGFAVAACVKPNVFLTTELWAGTLIAFSVCAYAHNWRSPGVAGGLLALFFRELALPYCLVRVALACWHKRRREVLAWVSGLGSSPFTWASTRCRSHVTRRRVTLRTPRVGCASAVRHSSSRQSGFIFLSDLPHLDLGVLLAAGGSGSCGLAGRAWDASELDCGNLPRRIRTRRPALQRLLGVDRCASSGPRVCAFANCGS